MAEASEFVFDTGPLSHLAEAGWLGLLGSYVGAGAALIPETVHRELADGVDAHPHLRGVLDASWLRVHMLASMEEQIALAGYTARLVGDDGHRNLGECGVLAVARVHRAIAVIDDGPARRIAAEEKIRVKTSLGVLCDFVREGMISLDLASAVADDLLRTEYRLPFGEGGFKSWAMQNDVLPGS